MYRAIIIDDDQWALADMKRCFAFETHGFRLCGVYDTAEEALNDILTNPPDLIVSDICMKKTSGIDLTRFCRRRGIKALIVLVSAFDDFDFVQQAFRWGVFQYLLKPLEDEKVEKVMRRAVDQLSISPRHDIAMPSDPVDRAVELIDKRYMDVALRLESVSDELFVNRTYLSEKFSQRIGVSFTKYKNLVRIRHAMALIRAGESSMTVIAQEVGFDSASYFSRQFKQIVGMSPLEYKRNCNDANTRLI